MESANAVVSLIEFLILFIILISLGISIFSIRRMYKGFKKEEKWIKVSTIIALLIFGIVLTTSIYFYFKLVQLK